jgi:hypothetical protein
MQGAEVRQFKEHRQGNAGRIVKELKGPQARKFKAQSQGNARPIGKEMQGA